MPWKSQKCRFWARFVPIGIGRIDKIKDKNVFFFLFRKDNTNSLSINMEALKKETVKDLTTHEGIKQKQIE